MCGSIPLTYENLLLDNIPIQAVENTVEERYNIPAFKRLSDAGYGSRIKTASNVAKHFVLMKDPNLLFGSGGPGRK